MNIASTRLSCSSTPLVGLTVIDRRRREDARGAFGRLFCADELADAGLSMTIAQINESITRRRACIRGLHFQHPPHAETKLVMCLAGEVFDVAVDLRRGSPTFLRWHAERLSEANGRSLLIPAGFAHGFQTLTDDCRLVYLHSVPYAPDAEGGLSAADPSLRIAWPLPVGELSPRDANHPALRADFNGLDVK
jgi:dTDP-4-dehydrorhamnose 3,5-epimerase